jgi:hypothetical protein
VADDEQPYQEQPKPICCGIEGDVPFKKQKKMGLD